MVVELCVLALASWPGHTPPGHWAESRLFHTPFNEAYEARIELARVDLDRLRAVVSSPDGTSRAGLVPAGDCEISGRGAACLVDSPSVAVAILTDRGRPLSLVLRDRYPNFQLSMRWTSETLLFVRVWWGRVLGTDLVVDVERQAIVYREMVHDGGIRFRRSGSVAEEDRPVGRTVGTGGDRRCRPRRRTPST